jgi:hypothetical protein
MASMNRLEAIFDGPGDLPPLPDRLLRHSQLRGVEAGLAQSFQQTTQRMENPSGQGEVNQPKDEKGEQPGQSQTVPDQIAPVSLQGRNRLREMNQTHRPSHAARGDQTIPMPHHLKSHRGLTCEDLSHAGREPRPWALIRTALEKNLAGGVQQIELMSDRIMIEIIQEMEQEVGISLFFLRGSSLTEGGGDDLSFLTDMTLDLL